MGVLEASIILLIVIFLLTFSFLVIRVSSAYAERGWVAHYNQMVNLHDHSVARISTLENKLIAHTWQEYANLQEVADEGAKVTQLNIAKDQSEFDRAEWQRQQQVLDGEDLEGELFEGPTLG